jgi:predicted DNA-binding protein
VPSVTSSFRISIELRDKLEQTAKRLNKGKNRIITEALDEYLRKYHRDTLAAEARRQSLLASGGAGDSFWEEQADARGWR